MIGSSSVLGGGEQVVAFAGAFGGQYWVAAGDQPFAGVVGVADLGEVLGVEQRHLQWPVIGGQGGDLRGAQRGDPPEIGCGVGIVVEFTQGVDTRGGDHAAIPDQHQLGQPEPGADDLDDVGERDRVGGIAGKDPHRDRPAGRVGEDAVFDLRQPFLPSRE